MSSKLPKAVGAPPLRPPQVRPPSIRNNHTPPPEPSKSKPSSSKIKLVPPPNPTKMSLRAMNPGPPPLEEKMPRAPQLRIPISIKSTREALKKLSSNKPSSKASRRPSEDLVSENSNKNGAKLSGRNANPNEHSRERGASNARLLAVKPALIAQKLLALNVPMKSCSSKQSQGKQNVFFETRKPTISFKGVVQQIRSQISQPGLASGDRSAEVNVSKTIGGLNNSHTTASTLAGAMRPRRLKTEAQVPNEYEGLSPVQTNQRPGLRQDFKRFPEAVARDDSPSFEIEEGASRLPDLKNRPRTLECEESVPQLKRKFVLNDASDSLLDSGSLNPDHTDSFSSLKVFSPPKIQFRHATFDNTFHAETVHFLIEQEDVYRPDPNYIDNAQPNLKWKMRSILLDWMQEVCSDYLLKRETFYYAVNYVDRYLSAVPAVEKKNLQLVGLTALYLAAKVEEVLLPKVENMVLAANNTYTASQITKMETTLYFALDFRITPPTLNTWANWYAAQWDAFVEESPSAQENVLVAGCESPVKFKMPTQQSYALYRHLMQLLDAVILEVQTLRYRQRALVLSTMYVLLGREYQQFTTDEIVGEFPFSSQYLINETYVYNNLFGLFLQECFGIDLPNLLPTIQYVASFFAVEFDISLPIAAKIDKENVLQVA